MFRRLTLIVTIAIATAATGPSLPDGTGGQATNRVAADAAPPPCQATAGRVVDRLVLPAGAALTVRAKYDYQCTNTTRRLDFVLIVPGSPHQSEPALVARLKSGLEEFVNAVDFTNGSRGRWVFYADGPVLLPPGPMSAVTVGTLAAALAEAARWLAESPTGADRVVVTVDTLDAGAPLYPPLLSALSDACAAVAATGAVRAVVGLPGAGDRLRGIRSCASRIWVAQSADGKDLVGPDGIFDQLVQVLVRSPRPQSTEYADRPSSLLFAYVPGSGRVDGQPVEPMLVGWTELTWSFSDPPPAGGRVVEYQLQVAGDASPARLPLSSAAEVTFVLSNGDATTLPVDNPEVCVYTAAQPDFCAGVDRPTPTPAGPTITPPAPATSTPAVKPTPAPELVWLPLAWASGGVGRRVASGAEGRREAGGEVVPGPGRR
jgi:hypothetical protein